MRVVVPYTMRHPETLVAAPDAEWRDVSADSEAYWRLMCDLWSDGQTFTLIEHDVVCRPDVLDAFTTCPEPWCVFPYDTFCHPQCQEAWRNMLGCTRFTADLIAAVPDAVSALTGYPRDWHNLCDGIGENLRAAGFTHHWHELAVRHHQMRLDGLRELIGG